MEDRGGIIREEAQLWIDDALYDLESAKDLFRTQRFNYVVWLARQAVEKSLKAFYMVRTSKPMPKTHNLVEIIRLARVDLPDEYMLILHFLNPHYTVTRYVDAALGKPSDLYDESLAAEALEKSERIMQWLSNTLKQN